MSWGVTSPGWWWEDYTDQPTCKEEMQQEQLDLRVVRWIGDSQTFPQRFLNSREELYQVGCFGLQVTENPVQTSLHCEEIY